MSTAQHTAPAGQTIDQNDGERRTPRSSFLETKPALKATELYVYLAAVVGVLTASYLVGDNDAATDGDSFTADQAWLYIVILTVGYLISRGLAKSGSRTNTDA